MALLQTRLMTVVTPLIVIERLADTVIGATFAWAFSFVLPSWSSNTIPTLVKRSLSTLRNYTQGALLLGEGATESQQLAREQIYEILETLSSTLRLSADEPRHVRPRILQVLSFIDHAQHLMAHLSALRLLLVRRKEQLQNQETEKALKDARSRFSETLELASELTASNEESAHGHAAPPSVPAERAAFPWLRRRIELSVHEALLTRDAALSALEAGERAERAAPNN